ENSNFRERISRLLAERYADHPPAVHVEQRIYDRFPSRDDQTRLAMFHQKDWIHRIELIPSIEDERYREFGERIIATEQPRLLTDSQRARGRAWRRERILASGDAPWFTAADAMAELNELADVALDDRRQQLCEIRDYLARLCSTGSVLDHSGDRKKGA